MAKKGVLTKPDYLKMEELKRMTEALAADENWKFELYITFSVATALRVCDVLSTSWIDVVEEDAEGHVVLRKFFYKREKKTGKIRKINFSQSVGNRIIELYVKLGSPKLNSIIFTNRGGEKALSSQYVNAELKRIKERYQINISNFSTHTFRKTFARHFWESQDRSSGSLILLMSLLNHSSIEMTKRYLAISDDEIAGVYQSFEI